MDILIKLNIFKFTLLLLLFHLFKEEEIINNPIMLSEHSNRIVIPYNDNYIILTSGQSIYVNKETGNIESNYNFCEYSFPYVLGSTESGKNFIYSSKKFCEFTLPNTFQTKTDNTLAYSDNNKYIGYIQESEYKGNTNKYKNCKCEKKKDEIIIYGKKDNNRIVFSFANGYRANYAVLIDYCTDIEEKILCRKVLDTYYSCFLACNGAVFLQNLIFWTKNQGNTTNCEISKIHKVSFKLFKSHTEIQTFQVTDTKEILCAKNINNKMIECAEVNFGQTETVSSSQCSYAMTITCNFLFSYPPTEENEVSCDFKSFANEYLFCCGETNFIKCLRLKIVNVTNNNWSCFDTFNLDLQGEKNNINILTSSSSFVSIFYNSNQKVYEYIFYIPTCVNKQYTIISFIALMKINQKKIKRR